MKSDAEVGALMKILRSNHGLQDAIMELLSNQGQVELTHQQILIRIVQADTLPPRARRAARPGRARRSPRQRRVSAPSHAAVARSGRGVGDRFDIGSDLGADPELDGEHERGDALEAA